MKKTLIILLFVVCLFVGPEAKKQKPFMASQTQSISQNRKSTTKGNRDSTKNNGRLMRKSKDRKAQLSSKSDQEQHHILHWDEPAFWWNTFLAIFLSCAGGFFSGMTVGLNSLDKLTLQVQQITGNQQEKKKAARILNTIKDHHLFLVTLLIGNAMVLEWLPLVVHKLMPDWAAILMSTLAVVIVAEIVPMSYTTGPSKYKVAYSCAPLVDLCIKAYYIIAYPIARGLDKLLGVHDTCHIKRRDFLAFVNQKKKNQLLPLQINIFNQVFVGPQFTSALKIMTPISELLVLCMNDEITPQVICQISHSSIGIILVARTKHESHNFNLLVAIKTNEFVLSYLRKKLQLKKDDLKLNEFIDPFFVISPSDTVQGSNKGLHGKQAIHNYNREHKITVVYSDTGLLDLLEIMRINKSSVVLVHKESRRKQTTDIAFLDAPDQEIIYDPFSVQDRHNIVGIVLIDDVFQYIVDFKDENIPKFTHMQEGSPVKRRRLVKRASIVSTYSVRSERSWTD